MIGVQQVLEKLGYLWRLLNIGLGSYGNHGPIKISNNSKTPHTKPLSDHYCVTSAFPACDIFPKHDFMQYISPSKFRSWCKHQRIIFSVQKQPMCPTSNPALQRRVHGGTAQSLAPRSSPVCSHRLY